MKFAGLKMLILISINILNMDLDLIDTDLVVELVETVQFSLDMSSPAKIDNRKNDILILGKGPTQGLEHHWLQKKCTQLISLEIKKIYFELEANSLFVNGTEI